MANRLGRILLIRNNTIVIVIAMCEYCLCFPTLDGLQRNYLSYLISSLTPRLAKKLFIEVHEVSRIPINRSTPSRISRMVSGGARSDRISDSASFRISETADLASASKGSISSNS